MVGGDKTSFDKLRTWLYRGHAVVDVCAIGVALGVRAVDVLFNDLVAVGNVGCCDVCLPGFGYGLGCTTAEGVVRVGANRGGTVCDADEVIDGFACCSSWAAFTLRFAIDVPSEGATGFVGR